MAQVDHRIGERLERVVHVTDAFEAQQQTAEFIFPGKDALDGPEAFLEDGRIKALLAAPLRRFTPAQVFRQLVASFSRSSNLSASRVRAGFLTGEA